MKKIKRLLTIGVAVALMFCACMVVTGCKPIEQVTKEDLIPETLGAPEGLYLYYDNYRSLTDGAETERLLNDITVDGVTYTTDEYYIEQIEYMTTKKEIFYILGTQKEGVAEKFILWHYNYDTKQSGFMHIFDSFLFMGVFENYIFLVFRDYSISIDQEGWVYDGDLNLVQVGMNEYRLRDGLLYKYYGNDFSWWHNGEFFSVQVTGDATIILENYVYLLNNNCVYAIDLKTGECTLINFGDNVYLLDYLNFDYNVKKVAVGKKRYFITYSEKESSLKTGCCLWELNGLTAKHIYKFPKKYEVRFHSFSNERYINFEMGYVPMKGGIKWISSYYDLKWNWCIYGWEKYISETIKILRVGEYEFYTDYKTDSWIFPEYYCCYLHRVKDGKDEILQYRFTSANIDVNTVFFNDIHVR